MQPQVFIILGRQGSGKGTQAKLLEDKFGLIHVSSGELLREQAKRQDFVGVKTQQTIDSGVLVPMSMMIQLWMNYLEKIKLQPGENFAGLTFDGMPRRLEEAKILMDALAWFEWHKNIKVILIDISRQSGYERAAKRRACQRCSKLIPYVGDYKNLEKCDACGGKLETRSDDTPEAINLRLDLFEEEVVPVIDFYEKKGLLVKINGEQPIEEVHREILEKI